jgi:hypothetical protein
MACRMRKITAGSNIALDDARCLVRKLLGDGQ